MISGFQFTPKDRQMFEEEFASRLPQRMLDNHIHVWTKQCLNIPKSEYAIHKQYKPWTDYDFIEEFTIEECQSCLSVLFPGKQMDMTCFGLPFPQVDRNRSNAYVLEHATQQKIGFYYMPGQTEDMEATQEEKHLLENPFFLGLKPYPDLVAGGGAHASIYDMLNHSALCFAHEHQLCVVLHIPRKNRIQDPDNQRELEEIARNYPNIRLVIAHVGRAFSYCDVVGAIDFLKKYDHVYFDTAFVDDGDVLEYLMRLVEPDKIIYGCDAPLAFTRGRDVTINNHHYYVCDHPVPWGIAPLNPSFVDLTFYAYEQIRATLQASHRVYGHSEKDALEMIFRGSALAALGKKGETIYA